MTVEEIKKKLADADRVLAAMTVSGDNVLYLASAREQLSYIFKNVDHIEKEENDG